MMSSCQEWTRACDILEVRRRKAVHTVRFGDDNSNRLTCLSKVRQVAYCRIRRTWRLVDERVWDSWTTVKNCSWNPMGSITTWQANFPVRDHGFVISEFGSYVPHRRCASRNCRFWVVSGSRGTHTGNGFVPKTWSAREVPPTSPWIFSLHLPIGERCPNPPPPAKALKASDFLRRRTSALSERRY